MRRYWLKTLGFVLVASTILVAGTPAQAHKGAGEGPPDAATWVRQALAFLELGQPNIGEAIERLEGALKAKDPTGVDLAAVREAMDALKAKEVAAARAALTRALLPPAPTPALCRPLRRSRTTPTRMCRPITSPGPRSRPSSLASRGARESWSSWGSGWR